MHVKAQERCFEQPQMTPDDLAYFKKLLDDTLDNLLNQTSWAVSEMTQEKTKEVELIDTAMVSINQGLNLRLQTRRSLLIKKIKFALQRIEDGTYGRCEICEEPISPKRLAARPVTSKCLDCKEAEERLETLMA